MDTLDRGARLGSSSPATIHRLKTASLSLVGWCNHASEPIRAPAGIGRDAPLLVVAGNLVDSSRGDVERCYAALRRNDLTAIAGLDGTYALLAHYPERAELLLGIDHFGLRPLYYVRHRDAIWCATALHALAMLSDLPIEPDRRYLIEQNLRLGRIHDDSQLKGVTRIRGNCLHRLALDGTSDIIAGRPLAKADPDRPVPSAACLIERLNARVIDRVRQLPCDAPPALWLSGGLDSRWISAALRRAGREHELLAVGGIGDEDLAFARLYADRSGLPLRTGDLMQTAHAGDLAEINWRLDATASLFEQMIGGLWPELRAQSPQLLHGYFWDWFKWTPPKIVRALHGMRRALLRRPGTQQTMAPIHGLVEEFLRRSRLATLAPDAGQIAQASIAHLDRRLRPIEPRLVGFRFATDAGPLEPFLTWGRLGFALGGGEFPLADTDIAAVALEAAHLPTSVIESLQGRSLQALDPDASGKVPVHPLAVPLDVLARGGPIRSGYLFRHPTWLPGRVRMLRYRQHAPWRMHTMARPEMLDWLRDLLSADSAIGQVFETDRLSAFIGSAFAPPFSWRAVSLVYELAALELFIRCFHRAQTGDPRPWIGLEPP